MRVIFVNSLMQNERSLEIEYIDGKRYSWVVKYENAKVGESFRQWLERKKEELKTKSPEINTILVYEVTPYVIGALAIRHAFITTKFS